MKSARQKPLATEDATPGRLILPKKSNQHFPISFDNFYMAELGSLKLLCCDLLRSAAVCKRASDKQFRTRA